ncbi:MAG TPA: inner membrane protein YiaA [Herpetosiphonaceae bacterium]
MKPTASQPSNAYIGASWLALIVGVSAFLIGLWNAEILLSEKGYYLSVLLYGLFAAVSIQKSVRDQEEGIPVTGIYLGLSWASILMVILLLIVGLWNATMTLSEKGFYGMSFVLSLFAAITVQKNTRDQARREQTSPNQRARSLSKDMPPSLPLTPLEGREI